MIDIWNECDLKRSCNARM